MTEAELEQGVEIINAADDPEHQGGDPLLTVEDGVVVISWPEGKPEAVQITSDMLEAWVDDLNAWRALTHAQATAIAAMENDRPVGGRIKQRIKELQERFGIE